MGADGVVGDGECVKKTWSGEVAADAYKEGC